MRVASRILDKDGGYTDYTTRVVLLRDSDGDGIPDKEDACPADADNDIDSDGVGDVDNCPADANGGQEDADSDGLGDACDACAAIADNDIDSDGVCGDVDNCPATPTPSQEDATATAWATPATPAPAIPTTTSTPTASAATWTTARPDANGGQEDADSDGVCGDVDNCPARQPGQDDCDATAWRRLRASERRGRRRWRLRRRGQLPGDGQRGPGGRRQRRPGRRLRRLPE